MPLNVQVGLRVEGWRGGVLALMMENEHECKNSRAMSPKRPCG